MTPLFKTNRLGSLICGLCFPSMGLTGPNNKHYDN